MAYDPRCNIHADWVRDHPITIRIFFIMLSFWKNVITSRKHFFGHLRRSFRFLWGVQKIDIWAQASDYYRGIGLFVSIFEIKQCESVRNSPLNSFILDFLELGLLHEHGWIVKMTWEILSMFLGCLCGTNLKNVNLREYGTWEEIIVAQEMLCYLWLV